MFHREKTEKYCLILKNGVLQIAATRHFFILFPELQLCGWGGKSEFSTVRLRFAQPDTTYGKSGPDRHSSNRPY